MNYLSVYRTLCNIPRQCISTHLLYLLLFLPCVHPSGVSSSICTVTGGVLGIHWSSVIGLGWQALAVDHGGHQCWESCCMKPNCGAVWSLGGRCVLLSCARTDGCSITSLPQPNIESLGLLQQLNKRMRRRRKARHVQNVREIRETDQVRCTDK